SEGNQRVACTDGPSSTDRQREKFNRHHSDGSQRSERPTIHKHRRHNRAQLTPAGPQKEDADVLPTDRGKYEFYTAEKPRCIKFASGGCHRFLIEFIEQAR